MVLALPYHFLDSHGVLGFPLVVFLIGGHVIDCCGLEQTWVELLVPIAIGWDK